MPRNRHPNKEIEKALNYAEEKGWTIEKASGHAHSIMKCPSNNKDCRCGEFCITSVWSTPRNPHAHARKIKSIVDKCVYPQNQNEENEEEEE